MIPLSRSTQQQPLFCSRNRAGFTLIELLVVIAIIIALAGIVFSSFYLANRTGAQKTALVQLESLQVALENYKFDQGGFPPSDLSEANQNSGILYQALSGNGDNLLGGTKASVDNPTNQNLNTVYLDELLPGSEGNQGWVEKVGTQLSIVDPWGNHWRYVSGEGPTVQNNVEFDLWSRGPDDSASEIDWIANWK